MSSCSCDTRLTADLADSREELREEWWTPIVSKAQLHGVWTSLGGGAQVQISSDKCRRWQSRGGDREEVADTAKQIVANAKLVAGEQGPVGGGDCCSISSLGNDSLATLRDKLAFWD